MREHVRYKRVPLLAALAVFLLGLGMAAPPAYGRTGASLSEMALQAAGGLVGSAVGTLARAAASVPLALDFAKNPPPCLAEVRRVLREGEPVDEPERAAALGLCLAQVMVPLSFGSGLVIAGGALGAVAGIAFVAQAQGRSGNLLAASVGVLAGNALGFYWGYRLMRAEFPKIEEEVRRELREPPKEGFSVGFDPETLLESIAWALIPVVLGVLAYNFL